MKKEDLIKLGIDEETAKKVEKASAEELKEFIPKAQFDEVNAEKTALQATLKERDAQLETLKNSTGDIEGMKQQISELQTASGYTVEIVNNVEYASYVEYGHRTSNHQGWVNGRFMMTISEKELEAQAPRILENKLKKLLREVF